MSGTLLSSPERAVPPASRRSLVPIVGRKAELAVLYQRLELALQGQRQVVFLAGDPGIGKTALVDTFLTQIGERADIRITSGQCVEQYGLGEAYLPLLEATTRLCRDPEGAQRIEGLKRYAPTWLAQLPGLLASDDLVRMQQHLQGTSHERMLREMAEAAEQFCVRRGLVLVLEDLHWSDTATLEWIAYIARRREPVKLLILGTYRPVDALTEGHPLQGVRQELLARRQCEELQLAPLTEEAIAEYLAARFDADVEARYAVPLQLTPVLSRRTGGNPLFIVNTVDDLLRQGVLVEEAGQWIVRTDRIKEVDESIPDTLRQLIERQIERLEKHDQLLLEVASVSGMEFAVAAVAAGLQTALETVEAQCEQLARKSQFIRSAGVEDWPDGVLSGRYEFAHALYQQVTYERTAAARRVRLHRVLGARKEQAYGKRAGEIAGELAVHFERGRDITQAVRYLGKAGENAMRRIAHQEALQHLTHGLELLPALPDTPQRAEQELHLQLTLGEVLTTIKGFGVPEVAQAFARARELCRQLGETPRIFRTLLGLWSFCVERAELTTAHELATQLLHLAETLQSQRFRLWAHFSLGLTLYYRGEQTSAHQHLEQSLALSKRQSSSLLNFQYDPSVLSCSHLGPVLWLLGYPDQARQRSHEALARAHELAQPYSLVYALDLAVVTHGFLRDQQTLRQEQEVLVAVAQEQGFASYLALGQVAGGWALAEQGTLEEGIEQMRQSLAAWRATGAESPRPSYLALLAEAYGKAEQPEEGLRVLNEGLAESHNSGGRFCEAELYRIKGELLLQLFKVQGSKLQVEARQTSSVQRPAPERETREEKPETPVLDFTHPLTSNTQPPAPNLSTQDSALRTQHLSSPIPSLQPPTPNLFRREGEYWTLAFEGVSCRIRDMRGLHYLAQLLHHPQEELHVFRLVTGDKTPTGVEQRNLSTPRGVEDHAEAESTSGFTDLGEHLDPQARIAYRRRIIDLQEELEESARFNDQGRVEQLRSELDFLTQELAQAVGLGGRARKVGSPMERARVTVTKAIKSTLKKITTHHPSLGRYLILTIKTGTYCSYTSDPRLPITWQS